MLAAPEGVRLDPEKSEEARGGGPDAVAEQLGVVAHGGGGAANDLTIEIGSPAVLPGV